MKPLFLSILIIALSACKSQKYDDALGYVKDGEQLVVCESPWNIPEKLIFYKSQQTTNNVPVPDNMKDEFFSYHIVDVLGDSYFINSNEFQTYNCIQLP